MNADSQITDVYKWLATLICLGVFVAHLVFPRVAIDGTAVALLVLAAIPWVLPFVENLKLPGGIEITFRQLAEAAERVIGAAQAGPGGTLEHADRVPPQEGDARRDRTYLEVARSDPNLALVALRIEIETRLRELASKTGVEPNQPIRSLLEELAKQGVLQPAAASGLDELVILGNAAAHGARVDPAAATWALTYAPAVLDAIRRPP